MAALTHILLVSLGLIGHVITDSRQEDSGTVHFHRPEREAYVTLATSDLYALSALVMGRSLRHVGTTREVVVMVTANVSDYYRHQLAELFDDVIEVGVMDSEDHYRLGLLSRPELGVTYTKLNCWLLNHYSKAVFLDADTLIWENVDDLFLREEFSAAPDVGWPDCFNSGVFVFRPSTDTYRRLMEFAAMHGTFDGADQGVLNMYYNEWSTGDSRKRLPYAYNVKAWCSYLPAYHKFWDDIKIVHYLGQNKPWYSTFNATEWRVEADHGGPCRQRLMDRWWHVLMTDVQPRLEQNEFTKLGLKITGCIPDTTSNNRTACKTPNTLDSAFLKAKP